MKYALLCILVFVYLLVTWRVEEGFKNAKTYYLYESDDWDSMKDEITTILQDTEKDRQVVLYGKNQDNNYVQNYLQDTADPGDVGVKIMIATSSSIFRDKKLKDEILATLNPTSGDMLLAWSVYTFKQGETESTPKMIPIPSSSTQEDAEEDEDVPETDEPKKDNKKKKKKKKD